MYQTKLDNLLRIKQNLEQIKEEYFVTAEDSELQELEDSVEELEEDGAAAEIVTIEETYASLKNALKERFDNKRLCVQSHFNDILALEIHTSDSAKGDVVEDIFELILRFRTHKFAFTFDIQKMFRQILVVPHQRDYLRILWFDDSSHQEVTFRLKTVTYGTSCAPHLAIRTIKQLALDEASDFPLASEMVLRDLYMDDGITGAPDIQTAQILQQQLIKMFARAGMSLHKWTSTSQELLNSFPTSNPENNFPIDEQVSKALGMHWKPFEDLFIFTVKYENKSMLTKRTVLSVVARLYDPLGLLGPVISKMKIFLQKLWLQKLTFDDPLPPAIDVISRGLVPEQLIDNYLWWNGPTFLQELPVSVNCADQQMIDASQDSQFLLELKDNTTHSLVTLNSDFLTNFFKIITSEDMLLMRGFIKNGEIENFSQFIWNCPGIFYCGDLLPTVTHEDAQYNLLQLATVLNSPLFCQVILDILQHPRFARRLFPNKTDDERSKEITKIIDMYLNSGSDETGDTPLHYASKLGYTDCCKILLANPLCKTLINHSGFTPLSLMFEKDSNQLKKVLTDGLLYVPIFRSYEDLQPFVGRPTNCKELKSLENFQDFGTEQMCKKHSLYFLNAFAGPMSSEMANKFYVTLNEPSSSSLFTYEEVMDIHLIKQQEPSRGLERIGRCLAQENELLKRQNGHWRKLK
ncbi:Ankyrin repeat and LEM domain-containing [Argiope bruennichi]|uniref:Ankyrin repeat and LEM domain-containing n=1 Tax=Argiope bruennichi TaxID=94029 RepID=A0A8T0FL86_ARGBR|nr:Ankyrin repeat and LEM domain-containing [Argiope bruennichi]